MLKIGEFSRLSRVSVRMLRHYDQLGLLKPSQTDRLTNYRYYAADQLPRLNRILALQDLGFSLEQIRGLLEADMPANEVRGMLKLRMAEVEQDIAARQGQLARLQARIRQMEDGESGSAYDVLLRSVRPVLVATLREVVRNDERIQDLFEEVEGYVATYPGARADQPPFTIYHDAEYRDRDLDAEVAVPLEYSIPQHESIAICQLPGIARAACVVHAGAYGTLYQAYNALLSWIDAQGVHSSGPIREVYLRYGAEGLGIDLPSTYLAEQPGQFVTELQMPVTDIES